MTATTSADPFAAYHQDGDEWDRQVATWEAEDAAADRELVHLYVAEVTGADPAATVEPVVYCLGGCGRKLTSAESVARGYGRRCWRRAHERAATLGPEYSDRQVEAAVEAIEDGAVVPAAVPGVWYVVGSKGDAIYETTAATCTCKHFTERGKACSHMAAVALVAN